MDSNAKLQYNNAPAHTAMTYRRSDRMTSMHSTVLLLSVYTHAHQHPHLKNRKHNAKETKHNVSLPLQLRCPSAPKRRASTIFSLQIVFSVTENIQRRKWDTWWRSRLWRCATSWKVAGSISNDVTGIFH